MAEVIKERKNKVEWTGEREEKRNVEESAIEYCERLGHIPYSFKAVHPHMGVTKLKNKIPLVIDV